VFNSDAALAIREWLREYTDHRLTRSTDESENSGTKSDSASAKRFKPKPPCALFRVGEEDNSLTKTVKRYNCLVLVGRPGIGKTSCVEAICHEENRTLQTIDCSLYTSFFEIKKEYTEAVKSQVVDISASALNRQPGTLGAFFSVANSQKSDVPKRQESKVFVIANIEHFLGRKPEGDNNADRSILKSMLDFFRLSRFPFLIKMTKASRNLIDRDLLPEFDFIEYTRPNLDQVSSLFDIVCRVESLNSFATIKEIKRFKERETFQKASYSSLLEAQLAQFEQILGEIKPEDICQRLVSLPSFNELRDFVSSFDFNFHAIVSKLNYLIQVNSASGPALDNSLWSLLNDQLIDEYRLRPPRLEASESSRLDVDKLARYPAANRAVHADSFAAFVGWQNQMAFLAHRNDEPVQISARVQVSRFLDISPYSLKVDLLDAQEEVYLASLGKRVMQDLKTTCLPTQDPEQFDLFRLLLEHSQDAPKPGVTRSFTRLRSKTRE
jgi:GTPase SAR1 family protein